MNALQTPAFRFVVIGVRTFVAAAAALTAAAWLGWRRGCEHATAGP